MRRGEEEEEEESGSEAEIIWFIDSIPFSFSTPSCNQTLHNIFIDKKPSLHVIQNVTGMWRTAGFTRTWHFVEH